MSNAEHDETPAAMRDAMCTEIAELREKLHQAVNRLQPLVSAVDIMKAEREKLITTGAYLMSKRRPGVADPRAEFLDMAGVEDSP